MAEQDLKQMFKESIIRLGKKKMSEGSVFNILKSTKADDHYSVCPFRDTPREECPLCKIEDLGNL